MIARDQDIEVNQTQRSVRITSAQPDDELAALVCEALRELDARGKEIILLNNVESSFSAAAATAIADTIKTLVSPVRMVDVMTSLDANVADAKRPAPLFPPEVAFPTPSVQAQVDKIRAELIQNSIDMHTTPHQREVLQYLQERDGGTPRNLRHDL